MPIQIDRMDTSIEITPDASTPSHAGDRAATHTGDPRAQDALREVVGRLLTDELERFLRNRGM